MVQLTFCRRGIATIIPAWTSLYRCPNFCHPLQQNNPRRDRAAALACGQELKKQTVCQCAQITCSNVFKRTKKNFPKDALRWRTMLHACVIETQRSVAEMLSRAVAIFSDA